MIFWFTHKSEKLFGVKTLLSSNSMVQVVLILMVRPSQVTESNESENVNEQYN